MVKSSKDCDLNRFVENLDWRYIVKRWWVSLLLLPFMSYQIHQMHLALTYNIFFSITYDFPFPVNVEKFLVSNFLLIIHEAGHTFFSIFGSRILTILGGSLNEILLPLLIVAFSLFNRYTKGTQFSLYLLGTAFFSVAFYAADGGQRQLPLIGNLGKESHDWYNILSYYNILELDSAFALSLAITGSLIYISALLVPLWLKSYEPVDLDLNI